MTAFSTTDEIDYIGGLAVERLMNAESITCDVAGEMLAGGSMLDRARAVFMLTSSTFIAWAEAIPLIFRSGFDDRPNHHVLDVSGTTEGYHRRLRHMNKFQSAISRK